MYDLIIRNGQIVDFSNRINQKGTLCIKDGIIAVIVDCNTKVEGIRELNAEGCYVTPGLIDAHLHVYHGGSSLGGRADLICPPSCVTLGIDAGSAGRKNFDDFYSNIVRQTCTTIKATISPSETGVRELPHEEQNPDKCTYEVLSPYFEKYRDTLVGIKLRLTKDITGKYGLKAFETAAKTAETLKKDGFTCRLMVHFDDLDDRIAVADMISILGENDVLTHIYRTNGTTIFDKGGKVLACLREAGARGVIFESGCARSHCSLESAKMGFADSFPPQIISTDLVGYTFYWKPSFSLMYKMSIYLNLGMDILEIIKAVTFTPAKVYNLLGEAGTLTVGQSADIGIFKVIEKEHKIEDLYGGMVLGKSMFVPMATVKRGYISFCQTFM